MIQLGEPISTVMSPSFLTSLPLKRKFGSVVYSTVFQYAFSNADLYLLLLLLGCLNILKLDCNVGSRTKPMDWMFFYRAEEPLFGPHWPKQRETCEGRWRNDWFHGLKRNFSLPSLLSHINFCSVTYISHHCRLLKLGLTAHLSKKW